MDPGVSNESKQEDSAFAKALNLLHEGKYMDGMTAMREAAEEESITDKIGFIAFRQYMGFSGGAAQALSDLRKNAEEHPRNLTVRLWLARALSDVGNVEAAVSQIHQALQFEASELLEKAQHSIEPNQRVLAAIGEIARSKQAEENMLETLIENSKKMRKWNQRYAEALLESTPDQSLISGLYAGEGLTLELQVNTDNAVAGNFNTGNLSGKTLELNGELEGTAITFSWKTVRPRSDEYQYLSSLLHPSESGHGLLIAKNATLVGYRVKGEWSLDAKELSGWTELTLTKDNSLAPGK